MVSIAIAFIALFLCPITALVLALRSKREKSSTKKLIIAFGIITAIGILSVIFKFKFTSQNADYIFISMIYLGICFGIWMLALNRNWRLKIVGIVSAVGVFGFNYFLCTVGQLLFVCILAFWTPIQVNQLDKNFEYREFNLRVAKGDNSGRRIEIYQRIWFFPIERRIIKKDFETHSEKNILKINVDYNKLKEEIYLMCTDTISPSDIIFWSDTIHIKMVQ